MIVRVPMSDPWVSTLFDGRYRALGRCDLALVDLEGETPVAGIAGRSRTALPVLIHAAARPGHARRIVRLIRAFVHATGQPITVTALDTRLPQIRLLHRLCRRAGGHWYASEPPLDWLAFYAPGGA